MGLHVGNPQVWGLFDGALGLNVGNLQAFCWTEQRVCMSTDLVRLVRLGLGLYVRNLQVLIMLPSVPSLGLYVGNLEVFWASFGLYVGNLRVPSRLLDRAWGSNRQVLWDLLGRVWRYMLATYMSFGFFWGLLDRTGRYGGNLQVP